MTFHEKVTDAATRKAAERLATALNDDFYLAGGTSIALQLNHRVSLDLDLFSARNTLSGQTRIEIVTNLKRSGSVQIVGSLNGTLHLRLAGASVSLLYYPYPLTQKTAGRWKNLQVAGLEDIAAMKLSAVLSRGSKKDFIDLYFIAREIGLSETLACGEKRFPDHIGFLPQACRALIYFDDAESEPMPRMNHKIEWREIKAFFSREIPKYFRKQLKSG